MPKPSTLVMPGLRAAVVLATGLWCCAASAQYKWVAPDGTVTYGDRPPVGEVQANKVGHMQNSPTGPNANLPFALRSVADRYPVTLYTTTDCKPCEQARSHLAKRGVPFSEKVVKTASDAAAMAKLGLPDSSFPVTTVGKQKQLGYEAGSLDGLLDNAGYPKVSLLPGGFKPEAGQQLTRNEDEAVAKAQPAAPRGPTRRERQAAANNEQPTALPSAPTAANPNGLRF